MSNQTEAHHHMPQMCLPGNGKQPSLPNSQARGRLFVTTCIDLLPALSQGVIYATENTLSHVGAQLARPWTKSAIK
jgi:hypothetical protein